MAVHLLSIWRRHINILIDGCLSFDRARCKPKWVYHGVCLFKFHAQSKQIRIQLSLDTTPSKSCFLCLARSRPILRLINSEHFDVGYAKLSRVIVYISYGPVFFDPPGIYHIFSHFFKITLKYLVWIKSWHGRFQKESTRGRGSVAKYFLHTYHRLTANFTCKFHTERSEYLKMLKTLKVLKIVC